MQSRTFFSCKFFPVPANVTIFFFIGHFVILGGAIAPIAPPADPRLHFPCADVLYTIEIENSNERRHPPAVISAN